MPRRTSQEFRPRLARALPVLAAALVLILGVLALARRADAAYPIGAVFLRVGVGARTAGMGDADLVSARDASVLYWNPAGLANLSEREILFNTGERTDWDATPVRALMRAAPAALRREDSIADAFHQMAVSGHRHLPVSLDSDRWAVVSARDLLRYLCK